MKANFSTGQTKIIERTTTKANSTSTKRFMIDDLIKAINLTGHKFEKKDIEINDCGYRHTNIQKLKANEMAVYTFAKDELFLKVGKVYKNSNMRYCYQHYRPNSSNSNLAKSLLNDLDYFNNNLNENSISDWIKENTTRFNLIIDSRHGIFVLNFIESFLHLCLQPKYEGFKKNRLP